MGEERRKESSELFIWLGLGGEWSFYSGTFAHISILLLQTELSVGPLHLIAVKAWNHPRVTLEVWGEVREGDALSGFLSGILKRGRHAESPRTAWGSSRGTPDRLAEGEVVLWRSCSWGALRFPLIQLWLKKANTLLKAVGLVTSRG